MYNAFFKRCEDNVSETIKHCFNNAGLLASADINGKKVLLSEWMQQWSYNIPQVLQYFISLNEELVTNRSNIDVEIIGEDLQETNTHERVKKIIK